MGLTLSYVYVQKIFLLIELDARFFTASCFSMSTNSASSRLIVKNLTDNITQQQVHDVFSKFGLVTDVKLMRTKSGKTRRFAFVGFKEMKAAQAAVEKLQNTFIGTGKVDVNFALPIGAVQLKTSKDRTDPLVHNKTADSNHKIAVDHIKDFVQNMTRRKGERVWADLSEFQAIDQTTRDCHEAPEKEKQSYAFDSSIDDLTYLKQHVVSSWDSDSDLDTCEDLPLAKNADRVLQPLQNALQISTNLDEMLQPDTILDTGRIIVRNLPYTTNNEELEVFFSKFGEVRSVHICLDEDSKLSRGFGFVTFVFPENAVQALGEGTSGLLYQGRIIRLEEAVSRSREVESIICLRQNFKKQREFDKKKSADKLQHTWNLLFVSINSAVASVASTMGVTKAAIFDLSGCDDDLAVRAAVGETEVIQQTLKWLKSEGINISAFDRHGENLQNSQVACGTNRSSDTIVVKHLPCETVDVDDLRAMFVRFGTMEKFIVSPSKTVAIVKYSEASSAKRAFQGLSFRRYKSVPLYLEWAPDYILTGDPEALKVSERQVELSPDESEGHVSIFIRNIDSLTTEQELRDLFCHIRGFVNVRLITKRAPEGTIHSLGYAFLEVLDRKCADAAIRTFSGSQMNGKQLSMSVASTGAKGADLSRSPASFKEKTTSSSRLCVRNVAFEATREELKKLFSTYGNVVSVRLPKKVGENQHRGFAFVEFISRSEALKAMNSLQHTHFYGRKLVVEGADSSTSLDDVREKSVRRKALQEDQIVTESKRRKLAEKIDI